MPVCNYKERIINIFYVHSWLIIYGGSLSFLHILHADGIVNVLGEAHIFEDAKEAKADPEGTIAGEGNSAKHLATVCFPHARQQLGEATVAQRKAPHQGDCSAVQLVRVHHAAYKKEWIVRNMMNRIITDIELNQPWSTMAMQFSVFQA